VSFSNPITPTSSQDDHYLFRPISPAISLWSPEASPRGPLFLNDDTDNDDEDYIYGPPHRVYSFDEWDEPTTNTTTTSNAAAADTTISKAKPLVFRFDEWDGDDDKYYPRTRGDSAGSASLTKCSTSMMTLDDHESDLTATTINHTNTTTSSSTLSSLANLQNKNGEGNAGHLMCGTFRPVFSRFSSKKILTPLDTTSTETMSLSNTTSSPTDTDHNENVSASIMMMPRRRCESIPRRRQPKEDDDHLDESSSLESRHPNAPPSIEFSYAEDEDDYHSAALSSPTNSKPPVPEYILVHDPSIPDELLLAQQRQQRSWRRKMSKSLSQILCKSRKNQPHRSGLSEF
jgi:hypothetical protein